MNKRRRRGIPVTFAVPILLAAVGLAFWVGNLVQRQDPEDGPPAAPSQGAPVAPPTPGPSLPGNEGKSPEEVAKAKGVPAVLKDPEGDYRIVGVIEGAERNGKLTQSLQIVTAQRQSFVVLSRQLQALGEDATAEQKDKLTTELERLGKSLEKNLKYVADNYGYSLRYNYRLVPHEATLHEVTGQADGKPQLALAHTFDNRESFEAFQALREDFLIQTGKAAKEAEEAGGDNAQPFEPGPELQAMAEQLKSRYNYDPVKSYQVNLEKTALYARPVE